MLRLLEAAASYPWTLLELTRMNCQHAGKDPDVSDVLYKSHGKWGLFGMRTCDLELCAFFDLLEPHFQNFGSGLNVPETELAVAVQDQ